MRRAPSINRSWRRGLIPEMGGNTEHILVIAVTLLIAAAAYARDPIVVTGPEQKQVNRDLPDGGLLPAAGVRSVQVFRADRNSAEGTRWTYNHHMDMACWKG